MNIIKRNFGSFKDKEVIEYSLDNGQDLEVKILNLGCIIRELNFKGKNRVLGYKNLEDYLNRKGNLGTVVGRVAGRISGGQISIDGQDYELDKNEGSTCLHGGSDGFARQVWDLVEEEIEVDFISLKFKYVSEDLEGGFPGQLTVYNKYTINKDNELVVEYFGQTDKPTIVTLTNHSYFNLNDDLRQGVLDQYLYIDADKYISLDEKSIPKTIKEVEGSPFDFRQERVIGEGMDLDHEDLARTRGYDHPFILKKNKEDEIVLRSRESGLELAVETTEPTLVVYTSNGLREGMDLSQGEVTFPYQGICLETQWYSDAINQDFLPKQILRPGEEYYSRTIYKFSLKDQL